MKPIHEMPFNVLKRIRGIFTDIDDTITENGLLPAAAYSALERMHDAGFVVLAITGRPAGWCDMIARFWPVDGVVGENGAFYFRYDRATKRMHRRFHQSVAERADGRNKLKKIEQRVINEVPGTAIAGDQAYRECDLAIDFAEDVSPLSRIAVEQIVAIFAEEGATAKISSIHVNGWYGDYDKLTMTRFYVNDVLGIDLDDHKEDFVYCGDSPNDAPMFAYFPNACGVANVVDFIEQIESLPAFVSRSRGARGFVEISKKLLEARENF